MKTFITNRNNLSEEDITEVVKRVKVLLINSKKELMLGYSHHNYQFPGGHVEEGEELIDTVNREVEEETGLVLNIKDLEPFACALGYWKDWPEEGKNRKTEIYYYEVLCDLEPNLENTKYTDGEIDGNFTLKNIPIDEVEEVLTKNADEFGDKHGIVREMLELFDFYKNNK